MSSHSSKKKKTSGAKKSNSGSKLPKLVAFDLDGTLWNPEMYQLWGSGGSPFTVDNQGTMRDCGGVQVSLIGETKQILRELQSEKWKKTKVAYVSCTDEPVWADELLRKFELGSSMTLKSVCDFEEIYKANKQRHFISLKDRSGCEFSEMLFFDNERGNCTQVGTLGVKCVFCPDGLTAEAWREGMLMFDE
eukprot:g5800.t1